MVSQYVNLYFPLCSLIVNIVLTILFFSKRKIKNADNFIYSKLLICGLIESIFMFGINFFGAFFYTATHEQVIIVKILNKILYSIYII